MNEDWLVVYKDDGKIHLAKLEASGYADAETKAEKVIENIHKNSSNVYCELVSVQPVTTVYDWNK